MLKHPFGFPIKKGLTLLRPMEFSKTYDTVKSTWSIVYIEGLQVIIFFYQISVSESNFGLVNSVDPDEIFIWVFIVCKSTRLEVSSLQRVNLLFPISYRIWVYVHCYL